MLARSCARLERYKGASFKAAESLTPAEKYDELTRFVTEYNTEFLSKSRKSEYMIKRHLFAFIAYRYFGFSYQAIADLLNHKTHGAALNSVKTVSNLKATEPSKINPLLEDMRARLEDFSLTA